MNRKRCWGCEDDTAAEDKDMTTFNEAFNRLIAHEGGYSNHPSDNQLAALVVSAAERAVVVRSRGESGEGV